MTVVLFELVEGDPADRPRARADARRHRRPTTSRPRARSDDDVKRHGAGRGSRWPALLFLLALLAIAAFVLWWSLSDERPEPRAPDHVSRRARRLGRVRERVVRAGDRDRLRLASVGGGPGRGLPRRARRRAADGPGCRPDAPAAHRAPLRDRPDVRLPARPGVRAEAARLGRGRRRGVRARPVLAALRLPRSSSATSTCSGSRRSCC